MVELFNLLCTGVDCFHSAFSFKNIFKLTDATYCILAKYMYSVTKKCGKKVFKETD